MRRVFGILTELGRSFIVILFTRERRNIFSADDLFTSVVCATYLSIKMRFTGEFCGGRSQNEPRISNGTIHVQ